MYKVIEKFADAKDYGHIYEVGDIYPREGRVESPERIEELSSKKNRLKTPLIELVSESKQPKAKKAEAEGEKEEVVVEKKKAKKSE